MRRLTQAEADEYGDYMDHLRRDEGLDRRPAILARRPLVTVQPGGKPTLDDAQVAALDAQAKADREAMNDEAALSRYGY